MKKIILSTFFLSLMFNLNVQGQKKARVISVEFKSSDNTVSYKETYNKTGIIFVEYKSLENGVFNKEHLIASNKNAIYITDSVYINNKKPTILNRNNSTNTISILPKLIKYDAITYFLTLGNVVYFNKKMNNKKYFIEDKLPMMKWELKKTEIKKINGFTCYKAELNYRGTKIEAYYTPEIPIPFGPWKFKGLPGLILELNTISGNLHNWKVSKITYPFETNKSLIFKKANKEVVSQKIYIAYLDDFIRKRIKVLKARIPKGVKATSSKLTRSGIEKKYEWE